MEVSVIIPIYNQKPEYFQEAVESVINQTVKPHEIIIVDDGSDIPIVSQIAKVIRNVKNMGIGYSRQRGVEEATGDYIAFLSSDDIWDERFLETMIKTAEENSDKILYSNYYFINEKGEAIGGARVKGYYNHEDFCIACWKNAEKDTMFVNFSTIFIPKKVFEKIQFDITLRFCEDLDFLLRSMKHFQYHFVGDYILKYRAVDNLTSRIFDKIPKQNIKIRKKCMEYWNENTNS